MLVSLNLNLYTLILLIRQVVDNGVTILKRTETETENIMEEEKEKETDREVLQGAGQNLLCPPVPDEVGLIVNIVIMTMTGTGTGMEVPSHLGVEIGMEMAMAMGTAMEVGTGPIMIIEVVMGADVGGTGRGIVGTTLAVSGMTEIGMYPGISV